MDQPTYDRLAKKHQAIDMIRPFWNGVNATFAPNGVKQEPDAWNVTAIICQAKTRNLTELCIESLMRFYPDLPVIVLNGSPDDFDSSYYLKLAALKHPNITIIDHNGRNGHGTMLDIGIQRVKTTYALLLDNDIVIERGGFIEEMVKQLDFDPGMYATGTLMIVSRKNEACGTPADEADVLRYAHPSCSLYRVSMYDHDWPFREHGAPCVFDQINAERRGLRIGSFPIDRYVSHLSGASWTNPYRTIWVDDHDVKTRPFLTFICTNPAQFTTLEQQTDQDYNIVLRANKTYIGQHIIHDNKPGFNITNKLYPIRFKVSGEYVCYLTESTIQLDIDFVRTARKELIDDNLPDRMELDDILLIRRQVWQYDDCLHNLT
jgi:glycosyltransferase involved in cell wall biosynthesis